MSPISFAKSFLLLVALALLSATSLGAGTKLCPVPEPATPESYTWDFNAEAAQKVADFGHEAMEIKARAAILQALARFPGLYSPESHAFELMAIRESVNRMGNELCRLLEIQRVLAPGQQETIDGVKVALTALATDTEAAIVHFAGRRHLMNLASNQYISYIDGMYRQANELCHCTGRAPLE